MTLYWTVLLVAIAASMGAQTLLKAGAGAPDFVTQLLDWRTIVGLATYGGSAMLYIIALRRIPMSVALPFTAVSYVAAAVIGHYAFHEPLTTIHLAAIATILAGVIMLAIAAQQVA
jgi:multidrug transporter EmrE-like cation transporter